MNGKISYLKLVQIEKPLKHNQNFVGLERFGDSKDVLTTVSKCQFVMEHFYCRKKITFNDASMPCFKHLKLGQAGGCMNFSPIFGVIHLNDVTLTY